MRERFSKDKIIGVLVCIELLIVIVCLPLTDGTLKEGLLVLLMPILGLQIIFERKILPFRECLFFAGLFCGWIFFEQIYFGGGLGRVLQTIAILLIVFSASVHDWTEKELLAARNLFLLLLLSYILWFLRYPVSNRFRAYFNNTNSFGMMAVNALVFFGLVPLKRKIFYVPVLIVTVIFVVLSWSRDSALEAAAIFTTFFLSMLAERKGKNSSIVLWTAAASALFIAAAVSYVYPRLVGTELGTVLNEWFLKLTNKRLFTGRQTLWAFAMEEIAKSPLIGLGLGYNTNGVLIDQISIHNLYLQTMMQSGAIGLGLFLLFFLSLFARTSRGGTRTAIFVSSVYVGVMIHEIFETSITQNNWRFALIYWFVFGIGLSKAGVRGMTPGEPPAPGEDTAPGENAASREGAEKENSLPQNEQ